MLQMNPFVQPIAHDSDVHLQVINEMREEIPLVPNQRETQAPNPHPKIKSLGLTAFFIDSGFLSPTPPSLSLPLNSNTGDCLHFVEVGFGIICLSIICGGDLSHILFQVVK